MLKRILSRNRRRLLTTFRAHFQCISGMGSHFTATRAGMWSCESYSKRQTNPQDYFAHPPEPARAWSSLESICRIGAGERCFHITRLATKTDWCLDFFDLYLVLLGEI